MVTQFLQLTVSRTDEGAVIERSTVICSQFDGGPDDRSTPLMRGTKYATWTNSAHFGNEAKASWFTSTSGGQDCYDRPPKVRAMLQGISDQEPITANFRGMVSRRIFVVPSQSTDKPSSNGSVGAGGQNDDTYAIWSSILNLRTYRSLLPILCQSSRRILNKIIIYFRSSARL